MIKAVVFTFTLLFIIFGVMLIIAGNIDEKK